MSVRGTVVIDPGHGGLTNIDGSDANHAVSPSGVLEKNMTLDLALRVRDAISASEPDVKVVLTRSGDTNLSLSARANVARDNQANLFLSIHFNGFNGRARGVEALVRPLAKGNVNHPDDVEFATKVQQRVLSTIMKHDAGTKDRGVKDQTLGVLRDDALGNTAASHPCRACLLEVEFIDVPAVDTLLNTSQNAVGVRDEIAAAIKDAIVEQLAS